MWFFRGVRGKITVRSYPNPTGEKMNHNCKLSESQRKELELLKKQKETGTISRGGERKLHQLLKKADAS